MTDPDLRTLLDDPAEVLRHDRAELRARIDALPEEQGGVGREVFTQAEAVFGSAPVTSAEFASWLHFAATVLGHREYAERVAAAEPGLPWRTVWAWWRPVGAHEAAPNLSGDRSAEVYEAGGTPLLKVWALWCEDAWFDLATGRRRPAPAEGTAEPYEEDEPDGPWLFDADDASWALRGPDGWEEPIPLDGGRYVFLDARGVAVVERNDTALADWPTGGADSSGPAPTDGGPWLAGPARGTRTDRGPARRRASAPPGCAASRRPRLPAAGRSRPASCSPRPDCPATGRPAPAPPGRWGRHCWPPEVTEDLLLPPGDRPQIRRPRRGRRCPRWPASRRPARTAAVGLRSVQIAGEDAGRAWSHIRSPRGGPSSMGPAGPRCRTWAEEGVKTFLRGGGGGLVSRGA
ncbi:hypothetical protein STANM309S_04224 [Streptomyces tanashiensis]